MKLRGSNKLHWSRFQVYFQATGILRGFDPTFFAGNTGIFRGFTPLSLQVTGILRGFDPFMNVVVDETVDTTPGSVNANQNIGMVVIRGNSIVMVEALEPIH